MQWMQEEEGFEDWAVQLMHFILYKTDYAAQILCETTECLTLAVSMCIFYTCSFVV